MKKIKSYSILFGLYLFEEIIYAIRYSIFKRVEMDNKIVALLMSALLITLVVMAIGFAYLQSEINSLKPQASLSPTTPPFNSQSPSTTYPRVTSSVEPTPNTYLHVVYTWHLKPDIQSNETWLNSAMNNRYNYSKTWSENYIDYINSFWEIPQGLVNSEMGVLAKAAFVRNVPVHTTYDQTTGFTTVDYQYVEDGGEPLFYVLEGFLPTIADDTGWNKVFS